MEQFETMAEQLTPEMVKHIFFLNGVRRISQPDIPREFANTWNGKSPELTETAVRRILHREEPFHDPELFSMIGETLQEKVTSRFRTTSKRKMVNKPQRLTGAELRLKLLTDALEAYRPWRDARQKAHEHGITDENLKAWLEITLDDV